MILGYTLVIISASIAFIIGVNGEDFNSLVLTAIGANLIAISCHVTYYKMKNNLH